jgi:hypothetical protein
MYKATDLQGTRFFLVHRYQQAGKFLQPACDLVKVEERCVLFVANLLFAESIFVSYKTKPSRSLI